MDDDFATRLPRYPRTETYGEPGESEAPVRSSGRGYLALAVGMKALGLLFFAGGPCTAWLWLLICLAVAVMMVGVSVARGEDP